ncbi:hypothetical protein FMUAM8_20960 [Nocardia cyriacigeorgica]|nr:hypothetical protein FMUAM8_20960 [Nocardia cyriacigeorgica]
MKFSDLPVQDGESYLTYPEAESYSDTVQDGLSRLSRHCGTTVRADDGHGLVRSADRGRHAAVGVGADGGG